MSKLGGTSHSINPDLVTGDNQGADGADGADGQDGQGEPTGGTTGQVLKKQSATDFDTAWQNESVGDPSPLTTKGDLYTFDTDNQRLPVGSTGQVLKANPATATGLEWAAESGGGGGAAPFSTMHGATQGSATNSTSFSTKGHWCTAAKDMSLTGVSFLMDAISGANEGYRFFIVEEDGVTAHEVAAVKFESADFHTVSSALEWVHIGFETPVELTSGTGYGFFVQYRDGGTTNVLRIPITTGTHTDTSFFTGFESAMVQANTTPTAGTDWSDDSTTGAATNGVPMVLHGSEGSAGGGGSTPVIAQVAAFVQGLPGNSEKILSYVATDAYDLPSGLTGSQAYADTAATAAATIDIQKNGVSVGSINFAIGSNTATFTMASATSFAIGDRIAFINQATADTTLADIAITLRGTLA